VSVFDGLGPAPGVAALAVQSAWRATGTGARGGVFCEPESYLRQLNPDHPKYMDGITNPRTRTVYLTKPVVCEPIAHWKRTGELTNWTVQGLVTIGHEAAHLRSVRFERTAECLGVRFAYAYMQRNGVFDRYVRSSIVRDLLDDSLRKPSYKLRGTCSLGGAPSTTRDTSLPTAIDTSAELRSHRPVSGSGSSRRAWPSSRRTRSWRCPSAAATPPRRSTAPSAHASGRSHPKLGPGTCRSMRDHNSITP
jgi:hypothetical protein